MGNPAGGAFGALGAGLGSRDDRQNLLDEIEQLKKAEHDADWRAQVAETNAEYAKLQVQELRSDRRRTHMTDNAKGVTLHIGLPEAPSRASNLVEGSGQRAL